jgi:hypothetical protein
MRRDAPTTDVGKLFIAAAASGTLKYLDLGAAVSTGKAYAFVNGATKAVQPITTIKTKGHVT